MFRFLAMSSALLCVATASPQVSTSSVIPLSRTDSPVYGPNDQYYVVMRVAAAQVRYEGSWWKPAEKALISTSLITRTSGQSDPLVLRTLQSSFDLNRDRSGAASITGSFGFIVNPRPMNMSNAEVRIAVSSIQGNRAKQFSQLLSSIANSSLVQVALGATPGAAEVAKLVTGATDLLVESISGPQLLGKDGNRIEFVLPFVRDEMVDGDFAIFGTPVELDGFPGKLPKADKITVTQNGTVTFEDTSLLPSKLTYFVLRVRTFRFIGEHSGDGSVWYERHKEITRKIDAYRLKTRTPQATMPDTERINRKKDFDEIAAQIEEMQILLDRDVQFTQLEKSYIVERLRARAAVLVSPDDINYDTELPVNAQAELGLQTYQDLIGVNSKYAQQVQSTRKTLLQEGFKPKI